MSHLLDQLKTLISHCLSPFKFITGYLGADCIEDYAQVDLIHFMSTYVNLCMSHKHRLLRRLCMGTQHHSAPVSGRFIFVQRGEHLCHWPVPVSTWMILELVISVGSMKWKLHYIPDIPRDPRRWHTGGTVGKWSGRVRSYRPAWCSNLWSIDQWRCEVGTLAEPFDHQLDGAVWAVVGK